MSNDIPNEILEAANIDKYLEGSRERDSSTSKVAIYFDDKVVGFYTPRLSTYLNKEYWRTGAIFILPEYRGKGLASKAITEFFSDKESGLAYIEPSNISSLVAFEKAGFVKTKLTIGKHFGKQIWVMLKENYSKLTPAFLSW